MKIKKLCFLFSAILLCSCNQSLKSSEEVIQPTKDEYNIATEQFNLAKTECYKLIENSCSRNVDGTDVSKELEEIAWECDCIQNYEKLIKRLKYYGLYDNFVKIIKNYDVTKHLYTMENYTDSTERTISSATFDSDSLRNGDILLGSTYANGGGGSSMGNSIAAIFIAGDWKHAGLYTTKHKDEKYYSFSASDKAEILTPGVIDRKSNIGRVGFEHVSYWLNRKKVNIRYVKNASDAQSEQALKSVLQFEGYPFAFTNNRDSNDKWYCSKLVYRAWKTQGFNLESDAGKNQGLYVTPTDIYKDTDTAYRFGDK